MTRSEAYRKFAMWYEEAQQKESDYPDAFTIATATADGIPSARTVLLKKILPEGFVFFTNYNSQKSEELLENPHAHMLFYWKSTQKQVRVRGLVSKASAEISDEYWQSRHPDSRINASLSKQSTQIESAFDYKSSAEELKKEHPNGVPRPENWGGFVINPQHFEFWEEGDYRWHKRECFSLDGNGDWQKSVLYP